DGVLEGRRLAVVGDGLDLAQRLGHAGVEGRGEVLVADQVEARILQRQVAGDEQRVVLGGGGLFAGRGGGGIGGAVTRGQAQSEDGGDGQVKSGSHVGGGSCGSGGARILTARARRRHAAGPLPRLSSPASVPLPPVAMASFHDFTATTLEGRPQPLSDYRGQVLLVVNVASRCGFTPQYAGLERLWRRWRDRGFAVLGFPCDQFGRQEPGGAEEIRRFCTLHYEVSFPMFAKVEVNGRGAHPLWRWLKAQKPGVLGTRAIKWNFTKFLVGRDGRVLARYAPRVRPEVLEADIGQALRAPAP